MTRTPRSKYGVRNDAAGREARTVDGILFASQKESRIYQDLKLLERAKVISGLQLQPRFPLNVQGKLICTYVADFQYVEHLKTGESVKVVSDAKGFKTPEYKLKKKLCEAIYGIEIQEV